MGCSGRVRSQVATRTLEGGSLVPSIPAYFIGNYSTLWASQTLWAKPFWILLLRALYRSFLEQ